MSKAIETVIRSINGGVFANVDYSIAAKSYIRKGASDGSKAVNPLWDRKDDIRLERENVQINLGVIYGKAVNGRLEKKELDANFTPVSMYGKVEHSNPHKNLCMSLDGSKVYVRYMPMKNKNTSSRFVLDGVDVTAQLAAFRKPQSKSVGRQKEAGLNEDEAITWRTLTLDNITTLRVLGMEVTQ